MMNISPMIFEYSSFKSLKTCLEMGLGLTICPEISIREELKNGRIIHLEMDSIEKETSVIIIWHSHKWCSPALKKFIELATDWIR